MRVATEFIKQDIDHLIRDDVSRSIALLNETVEA